MNILGISGGFGHEAAACLVRDGKIVAMVEEERLVRSRHAKGALPVHATLYCLHEAGIGVEDIDYVAASWDPDLAPSMPGLAQTLERYLRHELWRGRGAVPVRRVPHHLAHAASAWLGSGFDDAAVLVVDGNGEDAVTSMGSARGGRLTLDRVWQARDSLGHMFKTASEWAGLGPDGEGKLMGLAAYAKDTRAISPLVLDDDGYRVGLGGGREADFPSLRAAWMRWLENEFGPASEANWRWDPVKGCTNRSVSTPEHLIQGAGSVQRALADAMVHLAGLAARRAGSRRLVLAGGVALNCAANGAIVRSGVVDEVWVPPVANDAGGALGAALLVAHKEGDRIEPFRTAYLGPAYDADATRAALELVGCSWTEPADMAQAVAGLLADGACVGWFQGRAEIGPRALGARSLVARPDRAPIRDRMNRLKGREGWRPLSPSVLSHTRAEIYTGPASRYMLLACPATANARDLLSGVVHVDDSMRPQCVLPEDGAWHDLLSAFERSTGLPAVLNTSLNIGGEPIVSNPAEAIRAFLFSGMDALALGPFLVQRDSRTRRRFP